MASRRNRRTLKRQSKRIKGGIFEYFYNSTPQPQNATAPASSGSSWLSPSTWSVWPKQTTSQQSTGAQSTANLQTTGAQSTSNLQTTGAQSTANLQKTGTGGKRMRKTSKRKSRR